MGNLQGKVAIVTGAGRGIGSHIALKLAAEGAAVVVNDLDEGPAGETANAIVSAGGRAVPVAGNVTEDDFAQRFVDAAVDNFGGLDIIVNNAGYTWDSVIQKMSDEQWDAILDVHLKAPFRILRAAQPVISGLAKSAKAAGEAVPCRKVVNISSVAGLGPTGSSIAYAVSKAGLIHLTKCMAVALAPEVLVNCVAPGLLEGTRATANLRPEVVAKNASASLLGKPADKDDCADQVVTMCRTNTTTGQTLVIDSGRVFH